MNKIILAAAAAIFLPLAAPSQAGTLQFTLTGSDSASFLLDPAGTHTTYLATGPTQPYNYITYGDVSGLFEGTQTTFDVSFFDAASGGGLVVSRANLAISPDQGDPVFSGPVTNPVFSPGTFTFTHDFLKGAVSDVLVISDPSRPSAVPEPASWAMLLLGLFAIGLLTRRARVSSGMTGQSGPSLGVTAV